jgi:hypothetical protein
MKGKFGMIVVAGSGKIGGHVASHNRGGAYFRTKVTPINPQSTDQGTVRNRLSGLATGWGGLTDAQRSSWNAAVELYKKTNIFGDTVKPSGFNLYVGLNSNILLAGGSEISLPLTPVEIVPITALSIAADISDSTVAVTFAPTPVPADHTLIVAGTPILGPGKTFVKNLFRKYGSVAAAGTSPYASGTAYETKFGEIAGAGNKIWVKVWLINKLTGQAGIPRIASCTVAA